MLSEEAVSVSCLSEIACYFRLNSIVSSEDEQKKIDSKDFCWEKFTSFYGEFNNKYTDCHNIVSALYELSPPILRATP